MEVCMAIKAKNCVLLNVCVCGVCDYLAIELHCRFTSLSGIYNSILLVQDFLNFSINPDVS